MELFWETLFAPGAERVRVEIGDTIVGDGVMTVHAGAGGWAFNDLQPFRIRYRLQLDAAWRLRRFEARGSGGAAITLDADGAGHWTDGRGASLPELDGAIDVDIAACAFTNAPTINRLALGPGASATERVAYVRIPSLTVEPVEQRYTCVERTADGGRIRYENLTDPYDTVFDVDPRGFTLYYPDVFRRLWPNGWNAPRPSMTSGIVERDGEILLLRRARTNQDSPGEWEPGSGPIEPDESPADAAVRAVKEQTGLDIDVVAPIDTFRVRRGGAERLGLAFHCRVTGGTLALSPEHDAARWVPRDRLMAENLADGVRGGLARLVALPQ